SQLAPLRQLEAGEEQRPVLTHRGRVVAVTLVLGLDVAQLGALNEIEPARHSLLASRPRGGSGRPRMKLGAEISMNPEAPVTTRPTLPPAARAIPLRARSRRRRRAGPSERHAARRRL